MPILSDTSDNQKYCDACEKILPVEQFFRSNSLPSGYRKHCKTCRRKKEIAIGSSPCACGCDLLAVGGRRYVSGHNLRVLERTAEHNRKIGAAQKRAWNGGRKRLPVGTKARDKQGYIRVKVVEGSGYWPPEHVLIIEGQLGRKMVKGEVVHHINLQRDDNKPENLYHCKDKSEHAKIHASLDAQVAKLIELGILIFDREAGRYAIAR